MATGGRIILPLSEPCISNADQLVVGATLTVNIAGGAVLASLFADALLATPIANPQTSDASGRFFSQSTAIWADNSQAYDCILNYNNGTSFTFSTIYTVGPPAVLSSFAPINSPTFTGVPTAPTPSTVDNSNKIATTSYVQAQAYAPLASPALTGTPTAPTAAALTNSTQLATTQFVQTAIGLTVPTGTGTGYLKIAGIILQWTTFSVAAPASSSVAVTWPIAFPNNIIGNPWVTYNGSGSAGFAVTISAQSTTGATILKGGGDPIAHTGTIYALGN